jgi:radical SAM protein with 4Fe4S-binding SPASM domain
VTPAEPLCHDDEVMASADGDALIGHVQRLAHQKMIPLNVTIEITLRCNIRCLHCYNFDRDEPRAACDTPELSTEEILGLIQDVREAGCLFLMLTGGEILSHPALFTFLDRARELNLAVQLLTNGTMLRPGIAARLASYENLQGVSVSLYGATPEVHDAVTQMPGSWRRSWEGIERLRKLGVIVRIKFIVMKQNAHEVAAMRAMADERGAPYMIDMTITARHDGSRGSLETRVDLGQLEHLYRGPLNDLVRTGLRPVTEDGFPCNCARGNCAITATGNVQPCISVPWTAGNIREQSFAEIWASSPVFQQLRGYKIADYKACAPCDHKAYCSRNRGAAFNASGSYTGVDPFICATAELSHRIADERTAGAGQSAPRAVDEAPRKLRAFSLPVL